MDDLVLEIAGSTVPLNARADDRVLPVRLSRTSPGGQRLELVVKDPGLIGRAGLSTRVRLLCGTECLFSGKVRSQETVVGASGSQKRLTADGPFDWCDLIDVCDRSGVPRQLFASTTVGAILSEIFERHRETMRRLGVAGDGFYRPDQLARLTEPVDVLWIENDNLKTVLTRLMELGNYSLHIDPQDLSWRISAIESLDVFDLSFGTGSNHGLREYRYSGTLADCGSAVRLVGEPKVAIAVAPAIPAWDPEAENHWQLRGDHYAAPDADEPEPVAWVYRRFSYGHIDNLLDSHPVELVQKVPADHGGWTYQTIETYPPDRINRRLTARYPVLPGPAAGRVHPADVLPAGARTTPEVYIRYRYPLDQPVLSARYPHEGFSGRVYQTAGLAAERIVYLSDPRQVTEANARRLWYHKAWIDQRVELTLEGPIVPDLFTRPCRLRPDGYETIDLPRGQIYCPTAVSYDFTDRCLRLELVQRER